MSILTHAMAFLLGVLVGLGAIGRIYAKRVLGVHIDR